MRLEAFRNVSALIAAAALTAGINGSVFANPINYEFVGATVTFEPGDVTTITGTFTYDSATTKESNVDITLSGPVLVPPVNGTYTETPSAGTANASTLSAFDPSPSPSEVAFMVVTFQNPLAGVADNLASDQGVDVTDLPPLADPEWIWLPTSVTGGVIPVPAVTPEPALIGVLGIALIGIVAARRRHGV
jgi:hypothetical protein